MNNPINARSRQGQTLSEIIARASSPEYDKWWSGVVSSGAAPPRSTSAGTPLSVSKKHWSNVKTGGQTSALPALTSTRATPGS